MQHLCKIHRELKADTSNQYEKFKAQSLQIELKRMKKKQKTSSELSANHTNINQIYMRNMQYVCRVTMK